MAFNHVRTLVSGHKARYVDAEKNVNLDLVYVTDRIIIMGYPATGVKSLYRNRRDDVLRFLNSRHGDKWWIWNLCPLTENAYSSESMEGRVSRYPFPDHNPPPLPLLPLAVREMTAWLEPDPQRVAIIHCKAGKGRSGTLLVSYLLSLPNLPPAAKIRGPQPHLDDSDPESVKDKVKATKHTFLDTAKQDDHKEDEEDALSDHVGIDTDDDDEEDDWTLGNRQTAHVPALAYTEGGTSAQPAPQTHHHKTHVPHGFDATPDEPKLSFTPIAVGDEGPIEAPGQQDRADGKLDDIFWFHSSRRMKASKTKERRGVSIPSQRRWCRYVHLLFKKQAPVSYLDMTGHVRLVSVTMVLWPLHGWQKHLTSIAVGSDGGRGKASATIAQYKDEYVQKLRQLGGMGEGVEGDITWGGVGGDGIYDSTKMFKVFAKLGPAETDEATTKALQEGEHDDLHPQEDFIIHHLVPIDPEGQERPGLILDRGREFRIKLHLGNLPMGWAWFIPAFHMAEPSAAGEFVTLDVPRSQLDFPLGPGQAVKRVLMRFEKMDAVDVDVNGDL